ncbi:NAD(P)H-dependent oxidoreductase [Aliiroseovarius sp.]|uniref:FMN-dependent NADH-azoreductase n=1 Tax=Aliiroseovarius sp. TaxID=1872442 RepID=UPI002639F240|nr:NAD(P)H-dependent oxidoreductase [Aliiroseovarius sp.]
MTSILRIDGSARKQGSASRQLTDQLIARLGGEVTRRDLADTNIPHLTEDWVSGTFTPPEARTEAQNEALAFSDELVAELRAADLLVISTPVYNFGVPSALKAWVDQVARTGVTFKYGEAGPEGLLTGKRAVVVAASGGTPAGAPHDFAVSYLKQVLGFLGITEVDVVDAAGVAVDAEATMKAAEEAVISTADSLLTRAA